MGVYIKGMKMPTRCAVCDSCRYPFYDGLCIIVHRVVGIDVVRNGRPDFCPLVSVPPHGRLGDLDELYASLKKWLIQNRHSMTEATRVWIRGVLEGIAAAPTIIPAEEGE